MMYFFISQIKMVSMTIPFYEIHMVYEFHNFIIIVAHIFHIGYF